MVVGDDIGIAVLGLIHFQVGVLPRKLLARVDGLWETGGRRCQGGRLWAPGGWEMREGLAHLILLGELEAVVGLESFSVLCHVPDGDGRVAEHACRESRPAHVASHSGGQAGEGRGQGVLYGVSLRWTSCGLEGVAGKRKVWGGPHGGKEPRPGGGALGGVSPTLPRPPPPDNQLGRQVLGEGCPAGLQAPSALWQEAGK